MDNSLSNFTHYLEIAQRPRRATTAKAAFKVAAPRQLQREASLMDDAVSVALALGPILANTGVESAIFFCKKRLGRAPKEPAYPSLAGWPIWEEYDERDSFRQVILGNDGILHYHDSNPLELLTTSLRNMRIGKIMVLNNSVTRLRDVDTAHELCTPDNYWERIGERPPVPEIFLSKLADLAVSYGITSIEQLK